ncbi:MAG TPA: hypothetical protein VFP84_19670, partial [Kofleriaceae bacterium]|nr:hypothetical protein [Kofleriaceae bacterium]
TTAPGVAATTAPGVAPPPKLAELAEARRRAAQRDDNDAAVTEPSLPVLAVGDEVRVDLPVRPRRAGWSKDLAARVDAAMDGDAWGKETPIAAPSPAELRALLGHPDPTRQQDVVEIEQLQRRAAEIADDADPARRVPHPTAEVDPDDIEAAIEVAPPARRAHGVIRPRKKPE